MELFFKFKELYPCAFALLIICSVKLKIQYLTIQITAISLIE